MYIHEQPAWSHFTWDANSIAGLLSAVRLRQGELLGKMHGYGMSSRWHASLKALTEETIKSSAIEGVALNPVSVRSSIARRLGRGAGGLRGEEDRNVEGVVEMMLDATQNYEAPLNDARLCGWHNSLFPTGYSGLHKIRVAAWRDAPMRVASGHKVGKEKIHFVAPNADRVEPEMTAFLNWINGDSQPDPLLKAAIAHLWFVTIHPFEDGNGRITRAISELCLARSDGSQQRFYSMSSQILEKRTEYYHILESSQKGSMDITEWLMWFLRCLDHAIEKSSRITDGALNIESLFNRLKNQSLVLNDRQHKVVDKLFTGFKGNLTAEKWEKITRCSRPTAVRDISDLIEKGVLIQNEAGGRSTSYRLAENAGEKQ
ncbi:MAG TPA: Fic family protein [Candidatus Acidoferrales bacterium]